MLMPKREEIQEEDGAALGGEGGCVFSISRTVTLSFVLRFQSSHTDIHRFLIAKRERESLQLDVHTCGVLYSLIHQVLFVREFNANCHMGIYHARNAEERETVMYSYGNQCGSGY
jgi:S-adenosylmethionine/arginine decarboxylase-like enzyme